MAASKKTDSSAAKAAKQLASKYSDGEHLRVVPLHYPKPSMTIDQLRAAKKKQKEPSDSDLFDGTVHAAPAGAHLTYFGGPLLTKVQVYTIFWGKKWNTKPGAAMRNKLDAFFKAILVSPLIDQLTEYNVPGKKIAHGSWIGTKVITAGAPVSSVTDTTIRKQLKAWIAAHTVPPRNGNRLYFIFLDPGILSIMGGSRSCMNYCGYHNNIGTAAPIYYAVMPYPSCAGCLGGLTAIKALTGTSSHELVEAITDPIPGKGWYDMQNGEIGDICAWSFKVVAGYTVQLEWSNAHNACV